MGTTVNLNGVNYTVPAVGEGNWGTSLSSYLAALSTGVLQKAGGSFTLTADVDFGATYGLKSAYYAARSTGASAGFIRAANNTSIAWRNAANSADLNLKVNASNILEFNGNPLVTLALGAADTVLRMNAGGTAYEFSKLVDANIDASAAIAQSKIANLTTDLAAKLDDVVTANDNEIVRFNGSGQVLQNSTLTIDDSGNIDKTTTSTMSIGATNTTDLTLGRTGQTVYVAGNLIVQGDTVEQNVANMSVEDKNILINKGGTTAGAAGAGLSIEGDAAAIIATILYDATLASKFKLGAAGAESEILTAAAVQSISGVKTFTDYLNIDNEKAIRFREATANGVNYIAIKAAASLAGDTTFVLPTGDGTSNQVLKTDGSGNLGWATVAAGIGTNFDVHTVSSADYTVLDADGYRHIQVSTGATTRTITLPTAADNGDRMITVQKTDSGVGAVIIDGEGAETLNGAATFTLNVQYEKVTIVCNGTSWLIVEGSAATATALGLVRGGEVPGRTSGVAISAGNVGEKIELTFSAVNAGATGAYKNVSGTLALTAGVWLVSAQAVLEAQTTTAFSANSNHAIFIGTVADSNSGFDAGNNSSYIGGSFGTPGNGVMVGNLNVSNYYILLSGSQNYYLNATAQYTSTAPKWYGRVTAVRIA